MTKTNAPTMKDVAKEAGVSLGTVSKVINGITVREEYKKKVEAAIASLHYEINTYARGLKTKKTGLVAGIIPNMLNPFFAAFTDYIEDALYKKGLKTMLCCSDGIPEKEITYLNLATQNKVDGIVALTYSDIGNFINPDIPIVVFDRFFKNRNIPRVGSDNYNGSMMAIEKLLELGCRHPVYIRFHSIFPGESDKRKDGYLAASKKFHKTPDIHDLEECDNFIELFNSAVVGFHNSCQNLIVARTRKESIQVKLTRNRQEGQRSKSSKCHSDTPFTDGSSRAPTEAGRSRI